MSSALEFADSCDHYDLQRPGFSPDYIAKKWTQNGANGCNSTSAGRNGRGIDLGSNGFLGKQVHYTAQALMGWAVNFNGNQGFDANTIYSFSAANRDTLGVLRTQSDGTLSLWAGNVANLIANSGTGGTPFSLKGQVFYYFEVKTIVSADGMGNLSVTMSLHVNGNAIISGTAACNLAQSQTLNNLVQGNYHTLSGGAHNASTIVDDIYIARLDAGGVITDFVGDVQISALFPRSDVTMQWTAVGGSTNTGWDHVNEQFPETNDDTIYIKDNNAGDVWNANWQPIPPFTGTIIGVHYGLYNRKDGESTRSIQQSTQGTPNGPILYPSDQYRYDFFGMDADPSTGIAWTQSGFNGSTFGVKLNS